MIIEVKELTTYEVKALARELIIYRDTKKLDNFKDFISLIPSIIINDKYNIIMIKHDHEHIVIDDTIIEENIINFLEK